ncbi:MAG TPA: TolC family protein, partial [Nitrospirota bacterium]
MRTRLLITALLSLLLLLAGTASAENNTIVLDDLLKEAAAASPELAGLKAKYQAARERVPQEGSLEDPMLGIGFASLPVNSFAFDRDGMTGKEVELSQALPFAGKRGLKSIAAMHEAGALEQEYLDRVLMLRSEVKSVFYELYSEKKALEIIGRNLELLDAFKKTTESRYSVGEGSLKDIIKMQVESAMLVDKRIQIEKEQHTKRAYLASLIGRDRPVEGEIPDIIATPVDLDRGRLAAVAGTNRPTLRATQERIEKGSSMVELARKDFYPDFTVTARYMFRDNTRTPEG